MNYDSFKYAHDSPYPEIHIDEQNPKYARMILSNMGSCNSEMSAVASYFYSNLVLNEKYPKVAQCLMKINMVEMHHLDIFGKIALQLGADPRLWSCNCRGFSYWTPSCIQYPTKIRSVLRILIKGESESISKYQEQAKIICDENIVANLNRIILDEQIHLQILNEIYEDICNTENES